MRPPTQRSANAERRAHARLHTGDGQRRLDGKVAQLDARSQLKDCVRQASLEEEEAMSG